MMNVSYGTVKLEKTKYKFWKVRKVFVEKGLLEFVSCMLAN